VPEALPNYKLRRLWLKRLLLGILLLAGAYLLAANLFLSTPIGPRILNRNPKRLRVEWARAFSLYPGDVRVEGLKIRGYSSRADWTLDVDRGRGWIDLPGLLVKRFRVEGFQGWGVQSTTVRKTPPPRPPQSLTPRPRPRRRAWTIKLGGVVFQDVREIVYNRLRLTGASEVTGGFQVTFGGPFHLDKTTLKAPAGLLMLGGETLASNLDLQAEIRIDPYVVREHPGLAGFDFVSGSLQAVGRVPELRILRKLEDTPGDEQPGALNTAVHVEDGRLMPGSRFAYKASRPLAIDAVVTKGSAPQLVVEGAARGLEVPGAEGRPPLFASDRLRLTAATSELRLSRLLATTREIRMDDVAPGVLMADAQAEGLRLSSTSGRIAWDVALDRGAGRIDLPALLHRRVFLDGLRAEGVTAGAGTATATKPQGPPSLPWSVRLRDARLEGLREIRLGDNRLAGTGRAEINLSSQPVRGFELGGLVLAIEDGSLLAGKEAVAHGIGLNTEVRMAPFIPGRVEGLGLLRLLSGSTKLKGRVASLGFLNGYLRRGPALDIQGQGDLTGDFRFLEGRVLPGTRFSLGRASIQAAYLESLVTGTGMVTGSVETRKGAPEVDFRVELGRFAIAARDGAGAPYIRGRKLKLTVLSTDVDLATPVSDLRAVVDMPDAEVPDLAVYNEYLPPDTGVAILSGSGRIRSHMELDAVADTARGEVVLTSGALRGRFQELELAGKLKVRAVVASPDLEARRFDLAGTRIELDDVSYREVGDSIGETGETGEPAAGWWARLGLTEGTMTVGRPLALTSSVKAEMKDSDFLLTLFAQRKSYLSWFKGLLSVENVLAEGNIRLGNGAVEVAPLRVTGGKLDLRSRMRFSRDSKSGDLFLRWGRFSTGIELRDGKRDFKLIRPEEWYESRKGFR
jgi:hypothetical protein